VLSGVEVGVEEQLDKLQRHLSTVVTKDAKGLISWTFSASQVLALAFTSVDFRSIGLPA